MSLQTRLTDFATAVATDVKQLRVWLTGSSTGTLAGLTTTAKTDIISAINEVNAKPSGGGTVDPATEITAGIVQIATNAEALAGTIDTDAISPLKLQQKLTNWAQPLSANLTTLAGVVSGTFGRTLLTSETAASAKTSLGLSAIATSGSASDITGGTLPSSVMPPLAITDVFVVASQAAMLALTAQRGDVAKRTDTNRTFILSADNPTILGNWVEVTANGDVTSVAGRTGAVVLTKSDVGLSNVDNTSDANKPVSTAQQTALDLRLLKTANLSDLADVIAARTNLSVYSKAEVGNPETDLVAAYNTAKA